MAIPKIGLLPFYLELYDKTAPEARPGADSFSTGIAEMLSAKGVEVIRAPACRVEEEFRKAVSEFRKKNVDAIVTLHLAYSPSLESAEILAGSGLPVIAFDTTPDSKFGPSQSPSRIMFNHGIHGVQDLCNLLLRENTPFAIVAGHWKDEKAVDRLLVKIRSAKIASSFRKSRTGIIGRPFRGMGDFQVAPAALEKSGITVLRAERAELKNLLKSIRDDEIKDEIERNKKLFDAGSLNPELYKNTLTACLAVRKWIKKHNLTAFTMNFMDVDRELLPSVPFLEASKLMSLGIGYAGEGDVLTASLVGAVLSENSKATFTEMFCPDWEGSRVFMSHMGEANISVIEGRAKLAEKDFPYTEADNPVTASGRLKSGIAHIVNLAPLAEGKFRLIICRGRIPRITAKDNFEGTVRGWFKPEAGLEDFLEDYSRSGGTHHSVLVYGTDTRVLEGFADFMGWEAVML